MQELRRRTLELAIRSLQPDETARPRALGALLDLVDLLARERRAAGHPNAAHATALRERAPRDGELRLAKDVARIEDLELVTQIRAIGTVSLHCLAVGHPAERYRHVVPNFFPERADQTLGQRDDVVLSDERRLDVDLRELRLAVDPEILVAEASGDLEVTVESGHHEQLLVQLR